MTIRRTRYDGLNTALLVTACLAFSLVMSGLAPARSVIRHLSGDDGHARYEWRDNGHSLSLELDGEVEFTDDDRDVRKLSPGGSLEIRERRAGVDRRLTIEPDGSGGLRYAYRLRGKERPFDDDARRWLAAMLPKLIRDSGIGAEGRVRRILAAKGVDGVLDEIGLIEGSSATSHYAMALLEQATLTPPELNKLARLVDRGIASSGDRARFLIKAAPDFLAAEASQAAYFDVVGGIPSSGDRARVLLHCIEHPALERGRARSELLDAARGIPSSGDKGRVLVAFAPLYGDDVREEYFDVVDSIPSSGDRARVLLILLDEGRPDEASAGRFLRAAGAIPSSGDKARVLAAAASYFADTPAAREDFFDAVDSVASSGDRTRVLIALLDRTELAPDSLARLLASARKIPSSGDKTRVLVAAAGAVRDDDDLVEAYLEAARSVPSSGDRNRALAALVH